jgi:hypothetical protein
MGLQHSTQFFLIMTGMYSYVALQNKALTQNSVFLIMAETYVTLQSTLMLLYIMFCGWPTHNYVCHTS